MRKTTIILLFIMLTFTSFAFPRVYPSVIKMNIEKGRGRGEITVFNTEKELKKYKIEVRKIDNFGEPSILSQYLKVFPKYIEIKPGGQQTVRVFSKDIPIDDFPIGEVKASLAIEEIKANSIKKYKSKDESKNVSTMITFDYVLNLAIYGYNGELISKIDMEEKNNNDKSMLTGKIINKGNYSYPLSYELLNHQEDIINSGPLGKIISDQTLDFEIELTDESHEILIKEAENNKVLLREQIKK